MNWRKLTENEKEELTRINRQKVEEYLSQFQCNSHDIDVLVDHVMDGGSCWRLDTGSHGEDDIVVGEDLEEVERDINAYFDEKEVEYELTEISFKKSSTDMGIWDFVDYLKSLEGEDE